MHLISGCMRDTWQIRQNKIQRLNQAFTSQDPCFRFDATTVWTANTLCCVHKQFAEMPETVS